MWDWLGDFFGGGDSGYDSGYDDYSYDYPSYDYDYGGGGYDDYSYDYPSYDYDYGGGYDDYSYDYPSYDYDYGGGYDDYSGYDFGGGGYDDYSYDQPSYDYGDYNYDYGGGYGGGYDESANYDFGGGGYDDYSGYDFGGGGYDDFTYDTGYGGGYNESANYDFGDVPITFSDIQGEEYYQPGMGQPAFYQSPGGVSVERAPEEYEGVMPPPQMGADEDAEYMEQVRRADQAAGIRTPGGRTYTPPSNMPDRGEDFYTGEYQTGPDGVPEIGISGTPGPAGPVSPGGRPSTGQASNEPGMFDSISKWIKENPGTAAALGVGGTAATVAALSGMFGGKGGAAAGGVPGGGGAPGGGGGMPGGGGGMPGGGGAPGGGGGMPSEGNIPPVRGSTGQLPGTQPPGTQPPGTQPPGTQPPVDTTGMPDWLKAALGIGGAALIAPYISDMLNPGVDQGNIPAPDYYGQFGNIGGGNIGGRQFSGFTNPGLNPGFIQAGVAPTPGMGPNANNQYHWGAHPYMRDFPDLANYNQVPLQNPFQAKGPVAPQPMPFNPQDLSLPGPGVYLDQPVERGLYRG